MIPSKVITLQTATVRDRKTLVWLQEQKERKEQQKDGIQWKKWDGVVTSMNAFHEWKEDARIVGVILTSESDATDENMKTLFQYASQLTLICVSQAILSLKSESYWKENFDNLIDLEHVHEMYPFIGAPWNHTPEDAVALFASICRYHRISGLQSSERPLSGITLLEDHVVPEELWLITQYYKPASVKRYRELKECLLKNIECPWIDRIVLLNETDQREEIPSSSKLHQVVVGKRLTYGMALEYISTHVPPGVIIALANSDISMNDTLLHVWTLSLTDRCLALLRWEENEKTKEPELIERNPYSQDTWIMDSDSIQSRQIKKENCMIELGRRACDNAFLSYLLSNRFLISNPSLTLQTIHHHKIPFRTWKMDEWTSYAFYTHIIPGHILDMKQEKVPLQSPQFICNESVTFSIQSSSLSQESVYCNMLEKEGRYVWKAGTPNTWFEPAIPLYLWNQAGVTSNGLVFDQWKIYMGKHVSDEDDRYNYWKQSTLHRFTPLHACDTMLAIPSRDGGLFEHPDEYVIDYLSRCLRLRKQYPHASFWVPASFLSWLKTMCPSIDFSTCIPYDSMEGVWAQRVIGYLPGPLSQEVGRDDIIALQEACQSWWSPQRVSHRCVVMEDDEVFTTEWISRILVPFLHSQDARWTVHIVRKTDSIQAYASMIGATLCLFYHSKGDRSAGTTLWALPPGATVIEFQQELGLSGTAQHLAHVTQLSPWILLLSRGTRSAVQDQVFIQFKRWWKDHSEGLLS